MTNINLPKHIRETIKKEETHNKLSGRDYIREQIRIRDNRTCQTCRKVWIFGTRRFDIHHLGGLCGKKSKRYDKYDDEAVLITLCHKCHFNHPEHTLKTRKPKENTLDK